VRRFKESLNRRTCDAWQPKPVEATDEFTQLVQMRELCEGWRRSIIVVGSRGQFLIELCTVRVAASRVLSNLCSRGRVAFGSNAADLEAPHQTAGRAQGSLLHGLLT
jgi:hypothetical protein